MALVHSDATEYQFSDGRDGIISPFAITLCLEFDQVIQNGKTTIRDQDILSFGVICHTVDR